MTEITIVKPKAEILTPIHHIAEFQTLLEKAGRTCYQSEDRITSDSAEKFIKGIIKNGHESVVEHCAITVKIICSRSTSLQLVRHRIASYSQKSQRFVNHQKKGYSVICPPSIGELPEGDYMKDSISGWWLIAKNNRTNITTELCENFKAKKFVVCTWLDLIKHSYEAYCLLLENHVLPEDARSVLPNATETEIVTTFNLRQWRHVFKERALNPQAQWEIKNIMMGLLIEFNKLLPAVFGDLLEKSVE